MNERSEKTPNELLDELMGQTCVCGRKKLRTQTFCGGCYYTLSRSQRQALYRRVGEGYEEAYADAVDTLTSEGRIDG